MRGGRKEREKNSLTVSFPFPSLCESNNCDISNLLVSIRTHVFCRLLRTVGLGIPVSTPCLFVKGEEAAIMRNQKSHKLVMRATHTDCSLATRLVVEVETRVLEDAISLHPRAPA